MNIRCCSCKKEYSLESNIFEYEKGSRYPILICPYCGLRHIINFMLFDNKIEKLKKVEKLNLTSYYPTLGASRIADANRVDKSLADDGDVTGWVKTNPFILATRIYGSKGVYNYAYTLKWRNVTDSGSFAAVGSTGEISYAADTVLVDGQALPTESKICSAQTNYTWQNGMENEGDNILPDSGTYSLADEKYTELQWALDCSGAHDNDVYEFALYTNSTLIGTCLASIQMGPYNWLSPTGYVDPDNVWIEEVKAYDEDLGLATKYTIPPTSWSSYLELTIAAISCSKVRFSAYYNASYINQISLDVYYSSGWHNIYEGTYAHRVWVEKEIGSTQTVTAMRVKFYNSGNEDIAYMYEADFWGVAAGGDFTYTGTGTFVYSGTATQSHTRDYLTTAEGQFAYSGSALYTHDYLYVGNGSLAFSGSAVIIVGLVYVGSGSFAYSGETIQIHTRDYLTTAVGELIYSGQAIISYLLNFLFTGSGELAYSGVAECSFGLVYVGSGSLNYSGVAICEYTIAGADFQYVGSGSFTFSGIGSYELGLSYVGSGLLTYSGEAVQLYTFNFNTTGTGSYTFSGAGSYVLSFAYIGDGTLTYSGSAVCEYTTEGADFTYTGSGSFTFSGTATQAYTFNYSYLGDGSYNFNGSALYSIGFSYVGDGTFVYSGTATQIHSRNYLYTGSGELTLSGTAIATVGFTYTGSGQLTYSGTATQSYEFNFNTVGIGSCNFSGVGIYILGFSYVSSGTFNYSGSAEYSYEIAGAEYTGTGIFNYSGTATQAWTFNYPYYATLAIKENESKLSIVQNESLLSIKENESKLSIEECG